MQRNMHTTMITLIMILSSDMGIALLSEEDRDDIEDTYELIIQVAWCMHGAECSMRLVLIARRITRAIWAASTFSGKSNMQP